MDMASCTKGRKVRFWGVVAVWGRQGGIVFLGGFSMCSDEIGSRREIRKAGIVVLPMLDVLFTEGIQVWINLNQ